MDDSSWAACGVCSGDIIVTKVIELEVIVNDNDNNTQCVPIKDLLEHYCETTFRYSDYHDEIDKRFEIYRTVGKC